MPREHMSMTLFLKPFVLRRILGGGGDGGKEADGDGETFCFACMTELWHRIFSTCVLQNGHVCPLALLLLAPAPATAAVTAAERGSLLYTDCIAALDE